jgi:hypothetical protein
MNLAELQRRFGDALRGLGNSVEEPERHDFAEATIANGARLSARAQLEIYEEQYRFRHLASLRDDYASIAHYLGEPAFDALLCSYLAEHPPRHFSLQKLGNELPEFVHHTMPFALDWRLRDLAVVEEAFLFAVDASDAAPFDLSVLASIEEAQFPLLRVHLLPSLRLVVLRSRAHLYRTEVRSKSSIDLSANTERLVAYLNETPVSLVVARRCSALEYMEVDVTQFSLLEKLQQGMALGSACEAVRSGCGHSADEFEANLSAWFTQWTSWGWIASVTTP